MIRLKHARFLESFHIPLWLLKDTFWMLQLKIPAVLMITPTVLVALWIAWISRQSKGLFLPNIAVCFWISANATWMLGEFFLFDFRWPALALFGSGIVTIVYFFIAIPSEGDKI